MIYSLGDRGMEGRVLDVVMRRGIDRGGPSRGSGGGVSGKRKGVAGDIQQRVISRPIWGPRPQMVSVIPCQPCGGCLGEG